ncbi:hypothetical protein RSAG8_06901, partial [Rhizoctonia solani AG-8 WAC10335]
MRFYLALIALPVALVAATPVGKRCTGTISSLNDVANAQKCTTININAFTVPAGKTLAIECISGTTVNMLGDVTFGVANWGGPLFSISGTNIKFNGNGHTFDGQGPSYWDGKGGNGGVLVQSDGFDVSTNDLIIEDSTIYNQDDCIAINKGSNIIFQRNTCSGGHGISIGSVSTGATVKNVQILNNKIVNNDQALRIKTKADATNAAVTNVVFTGNTATGVNKYGVIVDQGYPTTLGKPGNNVVMSGITFGTNNIAVGANAQRVAVNCGSKCTGTWDWSGLKVTGGKAGKMYNYKNIKAGSY